MEVLPIHGFSSGKYPNSRFLGERVMPISSLYKYLDMDAALKSITNGNIRFVEPTEWKDKYEGRFYNADYSRVLKGQGRTDNNPFLVASCFTRTRHDESAPLVYCNGKTGLASICVRLQLGVKEVRNALDVYAQKNKATIYEGAVVYDLSESVLRRLHCQKNEDGTHNDYYQQFFSSFALENYLSLLLLKRPDFKHEMEHRFFVVPNNPKEAKKEVFIPFDWANAVRGITIMQKCSEYEKRILSDVCAERGIKVTPEVVDLYEDPDDRIIIGAE